jgi:glyoxylase-like metal-dependent hydrolase (beta-lactamase superfamily II)
VGTEVSAGEVLEHIRRAVQCSRRPLPFRARPATIAAVRELPDGVTTWTWFSAPHGYDFNGYFVRHADGNLCIDPVEPDAEVLALLAREGVARIVLTNRNHGRRAALVRERTGAPVAIHPDDAAHARAQGVPIDAALRPGEQLGPFTVVGVPGKSPGEVALYSAARRVLLVGDAVIGNPPGRLALLREKVMDDPPRLRASVRTLAALDVDVLLPGDGQPILADAGARLRELVATFPP